MMRRLLGRYTQTQWSVARAGQRPADGWCVSFWHIPPSRGLSNLTRRLKWDNETQLKAMNGWMGVYELPWHEVVTIAEFLAGGDSLGALRAAKWARDDCGDDKERAYIIEIAYAVTAKYAYKWPLTQAILNDLEPQLPDDIAIDPFLTEIYGILINNPMSLKEHLISKGLLDDKEPPQSSCSDEMTVAKIVP